MALSTSLLPDLRVISAVAPASASIGDFLNISWTVENSGNTWAKHSSYDPSVPFWDLGWVDGVYLSTDAIYDASDLLIGVAYPLIERPVLTPLFAGSSYTITAAALSPISGSGFRVPSISRDGLYYLIIKVNDDLMRPDIYGINEINKTNNSIALPINLTLQGPDLQLLSATAPATGPVGGPITVSWTVKNGGTAAAEALWFDGLFFSNDAVLDDNDRLLDTPYWNFGAPNRALAAGESYSLSSTVSLPSISTAGQYYLIIKTDPYGLGDGANSGEGQQGETNEANNSLVLPISMDFVNSPDLQLISATAPSSASVGRLINVSWTVKNIGAGIPDGYPSGYVTNYWADYVYLSEDNSLDSSDVLAQAVSAYDKRPLAPGASYTSTASFIVPSVKLAGQYYLIITTDYFTTDYSSSYYPRGILGESNEDNNILALPINLDLNAPDLQLFTATAPSVLNVGSSVNVSWTVKNIGVSSADAGWTDLVFLSADPSFDANDLLISQVRRSASPLAPGSSYNQSSTIAIPADFAAGQYYLIIKTNPEFESPLSAYYLASSYRQAESDQSNNSLSLPIAFTNGPPPIVTLSVSPVAGVLEDGPDTLIYTFTRSSPASAALTVLFELNSLPSNAALLDVDFSQTGATVNGNSINGSPRPLSISFQPGAITTTLTIDPIADSTVEPDEDIYLQLVADPAYVLGTTAFVLARILNDDSNPYTPGPTTINGVNLGSTSQGYALQTGNGTPVQITYPGGNASANNPGNGWSAVAASTAANDGYTLYWRNSGTGQTARWALNSSAAYTSGYLLSTSQLFSEEASLNVDLNGDGTIAGPTTLNGVNLGRNAQGVALVVGNAPPLQVTYPGGIASESNPGNGWSAVAASTAANGGYTLYWRNSGTGQTARWELNSSAAYTSGYLLSTSQLFSEEASLNVDINGDGTIAGPTTLNGVNLGRNAQGFALVAGNAPPLQVTYPGGIASESNPGNGWRAVAASTAANDGYTLYWRNSNSGQTARWDLNSTAAYTGGSLLSASQLLSEEANVNFDLNGDGYTSGPRTIQGVNLGRNAQGYALVSGIGAPLQVTYSGGIASDSNPGNGWSALAAAPTGAGFALYWSNSGTGQSARWALTSAGAYQSGAMLSASQLIAEEVAINADLNGDSIIGQAYSTIENKGNATLLRKADGLAAVQVGSTVTAVSSPFNLGVGDTSSTWQMLAAETVGGQNQILWRNNPGNFLHVWNLDSSWGWQSSAGALDPVSPDGNALLAQFGLG